jgi:hypothetical protein
MSLRIDGGMEAITLSSSALVSASLVLSFFMVRLCREGRLLAFSGFGGVASAISLIGVSSYGAISLPREISDRAEIISLKPRRVFSERAAKATIDDV